MATNQLVGTDTMNAPWGLASRLRLVVLAHRFFDVNKLKANHIRIGKATAEGTRLQPLTVGDFLKYLQVTGAFLKTPNAFRVAQIVEQMALKGLLIVAGRGNRAFGGLQDSYICLALEQEARRGPFRLVPALGPEFLRDLCAPGLVHITGTSKDGDVLAGTGLVVHPSYVLTCGHVTTDMRVDNRQKFQGNEYAVNEESVHVHPRADVAVIRVDGPPLSPLDGALFQAPVVARTVYTLGYPKLPGLREASVIMQQGAVTNESVTSLSGDSLFLYSAISRPGNSGGPVMSEDGYVVGLSIVDAGAQYLSDRAFAPHHAGIPAQVVVEAVKSLGLGIELPLQDYE